MCGKYQKVDQCEWELPWKCQEYHRHTHSFSLTGDVQGGKETQIKSLRCACCIITCHSWMCLPFKFRFFDEWPDQLQALWTRSLDLANCSFSWWTSSFQALVCSHSIVELSEGCRVGSRGQSVRPMQHVSWSWPVSILFVSAWGLLFNRVQWAGTLKERKTPPAFAGTCLWTDRDVIGMA